MKHFDAVIIGGGIGGAGAAAWLAPHMSVFLMEQEDQAGYHTTGRSAAFYAESYGGPIVQPLTTASGPFLLNPPMEFSDHPFVLPRGALHIFGRNQLEAAEAMVEELAGVDGVGLIDAHAVRERAPDVRWPDLYGAVVDPACGDLEVALMHQAFLKVAKRHGAEINLSTGFKGAERSGSRWTVTTPKVSVTTDIVINAAGAWADEVAERMGLSPLGLKPLRRTAVTLPKLEGSCVRHDSPVVINIEETCYFRPEGEGYLVSPADETPSVPCDAQPDEMDVAIALDRFHGYTGLEPRRIAAKWAGLRTFAPDKVPVIGTSDATPGYFWSAGQAGWGIQTAPAWSALLASLVLDKSADHVDLSAIDAGLYSPARFAAR